MLCYDIINVDGDMVYFQLLQGCYALMYPLSMCCNIHMSHDNS